MGLHGVGAGTRTSEALRKDTELGSPYSVLRGFPEPHTASFTLDQKHFSFALEQQLLGKHR
jgi:hypothetical protein